MSNTLRVVSSSGMRTNDERRVGMADTVNKVYMEKDETIGNTWNCIRKMMNVIDKVYKEYMKSEFNRKYMKIEL